MSLFRRSGTPIRPEARRRVLVAVAAAAVAGSLAGCSSASTGTSTSSEQAGTSISSGPAATAAPSPGSELDPAGFAAALKRPDTVILDVRTPAEFAQGHLPGAVNIDVESPTFADEVDKLDKTVPYAVYCRSGNRSGVALDVMSGAGFTGAYHLAGGITAWQAEGGEVVTD